MAGAAGRVLSTWALTAARGSDHTSCMAACYSGLRFLGGSAYCVLRDAHASCMAAHCFSLRFLGGSAGGGAAGRVVSKWALTAARGSAWKLGCWRTLCNRTVSSILHQAAVDQPGAATGPCVTLNSAPLQSNYCTVSSILQHATVDQPSAGCMQLPIMQS